MSLTHGELFAGYGGLGMGIGQVLDTELAWYSEIDKGALKVLAHRYPDVPNVGDITTVDWSTVPRVDVLSGGSPCQDLSHAGKRAGMTEGTRSNLWVAMREAIAALQPRLVVWENVRGAYSAEADSALGSDPRLLDGVRRRGGEPVLRALGRVVGDLSDLGYDTIWHGLRAADVGAPHGRFRCFLVAYPVGGGRHGGTLDALRGQIGGTTAPRGSESVSGRELLPTPTSSDTNGTGAHGDGGLDLRTAVSLLPTPRATDGTKGGPNQRGSSGDLMLPSAVIALLPTPMVGSSSPAAHGQISGQWREQMSDALARWGDYAAAIRRWEQLTHPAPEPTVTSTKGNPQLSAHFTEWLMGIPAGWITNTPGITRNEALKLCGNGVVPQQAAHALTTILAHLDREAVA